MAEYVIQDPDLVETKSVDGSGRLYLGKEHAHSDVRIVVEFIDGDDDD